ncbi:RIC8-like protein [Mya arenaria]|uniref:RIC8-like protein n=1 Tax=Mya arenaria TaxID=6604 RepID=A0ABY7EVN2_MYAAR|nr:RIC8-like protein [Mya arenaria]
METVQGFWQIAACCWEAKGRETTLVTQKTLIQKITLTWQRSPLYIEIDYNSIKYYPRLTLQSTPCFRVNPVTGRFEEDKAKPWEGMTDEQKEYEAMKLVNAMDKLNRAGIIQPSTLGEDGRPVPVSHILELMENQPNIPANQSDEEDE